tara:strand:+ start:227 stop:607 length:381 start_codon:yes stop_codon:yes gene_type:complete
MNKLQKRFTLFLLGCIPVRFLFVYVAKNIPINYLPLTAPITLIMGLGFFYTFFSGKKTGSTFNQIAWWNNLRPIHGLLYILYSYYAYKKNSDAYKILLFDVIFGLLSFFIYHISVGSFKKLYHTFP